MKATEIFGVNPLNDNCIVIDLFDLFERFKKKYRFELNGGRIGSDNCPRIPSVVFENKENIDIEIVSTDFIETFKEFISEGEYLNPTANEILICWNRPGKKTYNKTKQYYHKLDTSKIINFIKFDKNILLDNIDIEIGVNKSIDMNLCNLSNPKLSGTYLSFVFTTTQSAVLSYSTKTCAPKINPKPNQQRYSFVCVENSDENIRVPLVGMIFSDNAAEKYSTSAFKESCTCLAFEMYKNLRNIPLEFSKEKAHSDYINFCNNENNINNCRTIIDESEDIVYKIKGAGLNSLYNSISHSLSLIKMLIDNKLNPVDFVCTRKSIFVDDIKIKLANNKNIGVSIKYKDKINPYDVLIIPKKIYYMSLANSEYLELVQDKIIEQMIENKVFSIDKFNGNVLINSELEIPCLPVSLKENEALLGKGFSYIVDKISNKYSNLYLDYFNKSGQKSLFNINNFCRGIESYLIMKRFEISNEIHSLLVKLEKEEYTSLGKRIAIYGIHINKLSNNLSTICKNDIERSIVVNYCNKYNKESFEYWGIIDWRKHLRKKDTRRPMEYIVRESDELKYQNNIDQECKILNKLNYTVLMFKTLALATVALIQEFNIDTIKELVNYTTCKNFGQVFVFAKGKLEGKSIYPAFVKYENKHLIGYSKTELLEHLNEFPDIFFDTENNTAELRDCFDRKEVSIYNVPIFIEGFDKRILFTLHNSDKKPSLSIEAK